MLKPTLILLDRDGVINDDSDAYIKSPDEWHATTGSLNAIADLSAAGCHIAIITNQSGVGRGFYNLATLYAIHFKMLTQIIAAGGRVDAIAYCPHKPDDLCNCRKPKQGLFLQIKEQLSHIDFDDIYFVGDTATDIQLANTIKANAILVKTGKGERTLKAQPNIDCKITDNLLSASKYIIAEINKGL